jgi:hypothetical protein
LWVRVWVLETLWFIINLYTTRYDINSTIKNSSLYGWNGAALVSIRDNELDEITKEIKKFENENYMSLTYPWE